MSERNLATVVGCIVARGPYSKTRLPGLLKDGRLGSSPTRILPILPMLPTANLMYDEHFRFPRYRMSHQSDGVSNML